MKPTVGAEQLTVIRRTDQYRVVGATFADRSANPIEWSVGGKVQPVVEISVFLCSLVVSAFNYWGWAVGRWIGRPVRDLCCRLRR